MHEIYIQRGGGMQEVQKKIEQGVNSSDYGVESLWTEFRAIATTRKLDGN